MDCGSRECRRSRASGEVDGCWYLQGIVYNHALLQHAHQDMGHMIYKLTGARSVVEAYEGVDLSTRQVQNCRMQPYPKNDNNVLCIRIQTYSRGHVNDSLSSKRNFGVLTWFRSIADKATFELA